MTKTSQTSGAKNWNHHSMSIQYVKSPLFRSHLVDVQIEDPNKKKENIITQLLRQCQDYGEETGAKILNHSKWLLFPGTETSESDSARTLLMNLTRVKLHKEISYPVLM